MKHTSFIIIDLLNRLLNPIETLKSKVFKVRIQNLVNRTEKLLKPILMSGKPQIRKRSGKWPKNSMVAGKINWRQTLKYCLKKQLYNKSEARNQNLCKILIKRSQFQLVLILLLKAAVMHLILRAVERDRSCIPRCIQKSWEETLEKK